MISARRAEGDELARVATLRTEARDAARQMRGGAWLDEREAGSAIAVVGLIGSAVMGYALVECAGAEANLVEIYTTPAARDVGVGHAVIVASAAIAVASGCARLVSHALPGDRATKNFFETHSMVARQIVVGRELTDAQRR